MSGLPLRLAWREVLRHKGRSLLTMLLVALPLALLSAWATATLVPPQQQDQDQQLGQAQALVQAYDGTLGTYPNSTLKLGAGQRGIPVTTTKVLREVNGSQEKVDLAALPLDDPALQGLVVGELGHPAKDAVWISQWWHQGTSSAAPSTVVLNGRSWPVAGQLQWWLPEEVLVPPTHPLAGKDITREYVVGAAPSEQQMTQWADKYSVQVRGEAMSSVDQATVYEVLLAAVLISSIIMSTVVAAAFSIGLAHQRRSLSLLHLTGAPAATLRRVAVAQGWLLGVPASVLGVLAGSLLARLLVTWNDGQASSLPWPMLLLLVLGGVAASVVGAWLPSRGLARRAALDPARLQAVEPAPARLSRLGLVLLGLGLAATVLSAAGGRGAPGMRVDVVPRVVLGMVCCALVFFGLLLNARWLVGRLADRSARATGVARRLVLREGRRQRSRVVSALAAAMAVATVVSGVLVANASVGRQDVADQLEGTGAHAPGWAVLATTDAAGHQLSAARRAKALQVLTDATGPVQAQVPVGLTQDDDGAGGVGLVLPSGRQLYAYVVGEQAVRQVFGGAADEQVLAAFRAGTPLVGQADPTASQAVLQRWGGGGDSLQEVQVPVRAVAGPDGWCLLSAAAAKRLGLTVTGQGLAVHLGSVPSDEVVGSLPEKLRDVGVLTTQVEAAATDRYAGPGRFFALVGLGLLLVVGLVTTALAQRDARATDVALANAGASRRTLRSLAALRALLANGIGVLLGLCCGALPMALVMLLSWGQVPLGLPVGWLALLLLAPLALAGLAFVVTRPARPRPVRID